MKTTRNQAGYAVLACAALAAGNWKAPALAAAPLTGLLACRAVTDATARLACFDRESASLDPKSFAAATPPLDPKKQFGLPEHAVASQEVAAGTRAPDAEKIVAHLSGLSTAPNGHVVFMLDNDQVWRQLVSSGELLLKLGDVVTISRASLGSFWLQTATGRGCKVSRVK